MAAFHLSYADHTNYPLNLRTNDESLGHLEALKHRFDAESKRLCVPNENAASVFFRDLVHGINTGTASLSCSGFYC